MLNRKSGICNDTLRSIAKQRSAILMLDTVSLAALKSEDKFDPHQLIPPRTFLFALYILADCACINAEVFIYGVKINAGPNQ